jgi:hypothetical protein
VKVGIGSSADSKLPTWSSPSSTSAGFGVVPADLPLKFFAVRAGFLRVVLAPALGSGQQFALPEPQGEKKPRVWHTAYAGAVAKGVMAHEAAGRWRGSYGKRPKCRGKVGNREWPDHRRPQIT